MTRPKENPYLDYDVWEQADRQGIMLNSIASDIQCGKNFNCGVFVKIGNDVIIGDNVTIGNYCEIRDHCRLGNGISMGSRVTLSEHTIVEDDVIMKFAFVVADTPIIGKEDIKNPGILMKGSKFGANVTIMPGVTIGRNSEIGACSQVRKNVPDNEVWFGNPAVFWKKVI